MYFAHCYNYSAGDTFYAFGNTKEETLKMLEKAYKDFYHMTNNDVDYKTVLDYILNEKEVELLNVKTNEPVCYLHGYDVTFYNDARGKLNRVSNDTKVEYIPTGD